MTISLIDGDIVAYRCAASCEPTKEKPIREDLSVACERAHALIERILFDTDAETYKIYLGGSTNFRKILYPEYKANRKDKPPPLYLQDIRELLVTKYNSSVTDGIEADDALGINSQELLDKEKCYVCSIDKDLLQLPGHHYNFVKGEFQEVAHLQGLSNFYVQLIMGDASDNIPGYDGKMRIKVPKFLEDTVQSILLAKSEYEMFEIVRDMYSGDDERLLLNGKLLWIQRIENDVWQFPMKPSDSLSPS